MGIAGMAWNHPRGMEQNCAGFSRECTVALFDFYGARSTEIVFKLLKDVCSDFTDTNCIIIS